MNDGLNVSFDELEHTKEDVNILLNNFNEKYAEFNSKLGELRNYWNSTDYYAMKEKVSSTMEKIAGADGSVPKLMQDVAKTLEERKETYASVQKNNMGYWG